MPELPKLRDLLTNGDYALVYTVKTVHAHDQARTSASAANNPYRDYFLPHDFIDYVTLQDEDDEDGSAAPLTWTQLDLPALVIDHEVYLRNQGQPLTPTGVHVVENKKVHYAGIGGVTQFSTAL